uniref:Uncharacterized protein n=1 Tax=Candidatus Kentrum sp. FM TaxID=2126340 RepID=A0A450TTX0_9GAMM|nr:MAG: hypothetical protein BECKFM1743C_GA0114222_106383 [Candidatus Kentron sp. FM]VFJ73876.1 MAG: hypothetical protein BECKFM1743A_GA0114220_107443 [Candidatus Kentron sp. FM]VFK22100.1 MAG: hypothetical protein BECKFM1743B_GA0114221_108393 [Candidatus Kentron sp. FM]
MKTEIDRLDDRYPEPVSNIIRRFPRVSSHEPRVTGEGAGKWIPSETKAMNVLQEIADSGGLGISDPLAWQREIREDSALPFRGG